MGDTLMTHHSLNRIEFSPPANQPFADVAAMSPVDMAGRIGYLETALKDTKRCLAFAEAKLRPFIAPMTASQREWIVSFLTDLGVDDLSAEAVVIACESEGITIALPTEECDRCGYEDTTDKFTGRHDVARLCPTCSRRESDEP